MPENTLPPSERTVVVNQSRYGILTIVSLCFNALIFLVLLLAIAGHSHDQKDSRGDSDHDRGGDRHEGMRFHHHDFGRESRDWGSRGGDFERGEGQGWNRRGSEGGPGFGGSGEEQSWGRGQGGDRAGGPEGFSGGAGRFGFGGSTGVKTAPTAASMTDMIMAHLSRQLSLTDQENTQIRPVVEQQVTQMQKDMETQRQARTKALDDATAKIRPLLNADQQKQLDQIKTAMEQKTAATAESTSADKAKGE